MKRHWTTVAARVAAQHPAWTWPQVCAYVARLRPRRLPKPAVASVVARLEQMKLF